MKSSSVLMFFVILCGLLAILNGYFMYNTPTPISVAATVLNVIGCVSCLIAYVICKE